MRKKEGIDMYENDIYDGTTGSMNEGDTEKNVMHDSSVNCGSTGNNAANSQQASGSGSNPYFDYTTYPTDDLNRRATASRQDEKKREKEEKAARKAEKKAAKAARKASKSGRTFGKVALSVGLGLCFGVFAGLGFYAVGLGTGQFKTASGQAEEVRDTTIPQDAGLSMTQQDVDTSAQPTYITYTSSDISDVVSEVMPAMVSIVNSYTTTETNFWGQSYSTPAASSGSGIIVAENESDNELLIVTNNHVVEDTTTLEVTFIDESTAEAVIKGLDSDMDLAVIAVSLDSLSDETRDAIAIAKLGDSDNLELGEPVIAIGNALGYGQSVTNGIVSALNREIELEDGSTGTFIQTNAAINPGNSGGALLNINGEVIGINSNKIGGTTIEGMGYAIPISSASPIIADLMERQTRTKVADDEMGYIGITMQEITEQSMQMYNMPAGVFIYEVQQGSPAEAAGLKRGDIVVKFDGQKITSASDLQNALQYYKAGETTTITVKRSVNGEYESIDLEITLGARTQN
jgi:serine protease Do